MAVKALNESTEIGVCALTMALSPAVNSLDIIWVSATAVPDGFSFIQTGRDLLQIKNSHASSPWTFTIKSQPDDLNRVGDIGPYTLQAGEVTKPLLINNKGFRDGNGAVTVQVSDLSVQIAVNRTPNILS